jgi:cardiolipin synthase
MNEVLINEQIFLNGENFFYALVQELALAQETIDLETYIFQNDKLGQQIAHTLIAAAKRGVKVRVMVDGAGTPWWGNTLTKEMVNAGIQARVFHAFPWRLWQWHHNSIKRSWIYQAFYLLSRINKRNHRKVCIIDNRIVFISSANISLCHLSTQQGGQNWRDTGVRLENADFKDLREAFDIAWNHQPLQEKIQTIFEKINKKALIRLNHTRHLRRSLYKSLLLRISKCRNRVWITNAYFVPDNRLLHRLTELAEEGVDVRIMLPHKSDIIFMPWATAAFYDKLLKAGVRIFEYNPSMLHAKSLILDDWFLIGSSNLNHRSLFHDLEVDVVIQTPEAKKSLEQQFLLDLEQSTEIKWVNWLKGGFFKKIIGRLLLYLKYWI